MEDWRWWNYPLWTPAFEKVTTCWAISLCLYVILFHVILSPEKKPFYQVWTHTCAWPLHSPRQRLTLQQVNHGWCLWGCLACGQDYPVRMLSIPVSDQAWSWSNTLLSIFFFLSLCACTLLPRKCKSWIVTSPDGSKRSCVTEGLPAIASPTASGSRNSKEALMWRSPPQFLLQSEGSKRPHVCFKGLSCMAWERGRGMSEIRATAPHPP